MLFNSLKINSYCTLGDTVIMCALENETYLYCNMLYYPFYRQIKLMKFILVYLLHACNDSNASRRTGYTFKSALALAFY